jgi:hypothetical protein
MTPLSYISPKAMVRHSPIHGRELFAVGPILKGDIVAIKGGYIYDRARRDRLPPHSSHMCLGFLVQLVMIQYPNYHAARVGAAAMTVATDFVDQLNGGAC